MNEILSYIINLLIAITILFITRYIIPLIKEKLGTEKLAIAEKWAKYAVLTAQQTLQASTGTEKKEYVTQFLKDLLASKNIPLTDEELNVLIESAVKAMKMEEG